MRQGREERPASRCPSSAGKAAVHSRWWALDRGHQISRDGSVMPLPEPPALGTAMLPPGTYDGDVVLITGGGTGLGQAMAVEFARLGAALAIVSRNPEHRAAGVAAVEAVGGRAFGVGADIRNSDSVDAAFDAVEEALGGVSVLVNNAAGNFQVPAESMSANAWRAVTQIVLDGTFFCSRSF